MEYLKLENVTKSFGEKTLFTDLNLTISKGDKIALVAKNGTGKTTLLKVIANEESGEGENCNIFIAKNMRTGYLRQDPQFIDNWTIIETVFDSENPLILAVKDYELALLQPDKAEALQSALSAMDDLKAWDVEARVKEVLFKLNIKDLDKEVGTLSGGQKKRLALAKMIIDEPDFLILDEPTNHLDLEMIEWLEEYLNNPNRTVFMVTHDRFFLERVCNYIVELESGVIHKYSGNYSDYLIKKTSRHEVESAELEKTKKLMKRELEWVRRMPKARTTKAKSRTDNFEVIKEKASKKIDNQKVEIDIKAARMGSKILEAHYISKSFGDLKLIDKFHYKFKKRERVGIVGKNGVGKSTFLKLLTKEIKPDEGTVVIGGTVQFGYYTQDGIKLAEDKRVIDVITDIAEFIPLEKGKKLTASSLLERFLFSKPQQQVYASQLSGGERRRLYLLTVLMQNPNFLILDEPTNDLDLVTLNVLEDFLSEFPGCIIIVSHDRYFMDKIVDHLFIFEGDGKIRDYNGKYTEYRALKALEDIEAKRIASLNNTPKEKAVKSKDTSTELSYEQRKEVKRLEKDIAKLEEKKGEIQAKFMNSGISQEQILEFSKELKEVEAKIEDKEMRWMELADMA